MRKARDPTDEVQTDEVRNAGQHPVDGIPPSGARHSFNAVSWKIRAGTRIQPSQSSGSADATLRGLVGESPLARRERNASPQPDRWTKGNPRLRRGILRRLANYGESRESLPAQSEDRRFAPTGSTPRESGRRDERSKREGPDTSPRTVRSDENPCRSKDLGETEPQRRLPTDTESVSEE